MVIAVIALFVALGGTAVAAGIVPKAKVALNALKLQGKTAAQVAAVPGPASSASGLVATRTVSFTIGANGLQQVSAACQSGEKAISGGYSTSGAVLQATSAPSSDGASWQMALVNVADSSASGTGYAVCLK
jgi:hypothetical protein